MRTSNTCRSQVGSAACLEKAPLCFAVGGRTASLVKGPLSAQIDCSTAVRHERDVQQLDATPSISAQSLLTFEGASRPFPRPPILAFPFPSLLVSPTHSSRSVLMTNTSGEGGRRHSLFRIASTVCESCESCEFFPHDTLCLLAPLHPLFLAYAAAGVRLTRLTSKYNCYPRDSHVGHH